MRNGEPSEDEIADLIEGRLDDLRALEVERWLARHPEREAEIRRQRELDDALKGLGAEILEEPIPDRLRRVLEQSNIAPEATGAGMPVAKWWRSSTFVRALSALALLLVGAAAGWLGRAALEPESGPIDTLLADASYAYTFYSRDREHGIEFPPDGLDRFSEASKKLFARAVGPPDLGPAGYQYRGARIAPTGRQTSTFFFFEGKEGDNLVVLFWRRGEDSPDDPGFRLLGKVAASFWFFEDLGFAVLARGADEKRLGEISDDIIDFYDDPAGG
jgi:anti-sigma factor RsiW